MNPETDRIPVPTNGRGPHPPAPASDAADVADRPAASPDPATPAASTLAVTAPALTVTPGQLAVGFGIVASLVLLLVGRSRRRRG